MPVDVYVPGCPPRPEGLIYGMMKLGQLVKERRGHWPDRPDRAQRAAGRLAMDRPLRKRLETRFADKLTGPVRQRHDTTELRIGPGDLIEVMTALHDEPELAFVVLADLAGVDTGDHMQVDLPPVVGDDPGLAARHRRRPARATTRAIPSLTGLWPGAEWMERETYDMFGIIFEGNRDLRRIYMPPDYTSFPLRKDFYLADDAARSPGGGVRHMEQTHAPAQATERVVRRTVKA